MKLKLSNSRRKLSLAFIVVLMLTVLSSNALAWKFVVYGDTRTNREDHRAALQLIMDYTPDYEFIVNVGDVVQNGRSSSQWTDWRNDVLNVLGHDGQHPDSANYYSCPGNHDRFDEPDGFTNWTTYLYRQATDFPETNGEYFYFDYNNARFIILNFERSINEQRVLIDSAIATNPHPWLFAIWHGPIFTYSDKSYDDNIHERWGIPLYKGGCDIFFVGHAHSYIRTKKIALDGTETPEIDSDNGTVQLMTGNGGADRDPIYDVNEDGFGYLATGNYTTDNSVGFTEIEIDGDTLILKHYDNSVVGGKLLDSALYTPNVPCDDCVPSDPLSAAGVVDSCNQITVSWLDNAGEEDNYIIEQSISGEYTAIDTIPANSNSYTISGLEELTAYSFRVFAINENGPSGKVTINKTTLACLISTDDKLIGTSKGKISISPNPTSGLLNININDNEFNTGRLNVYNSAGALVLSKSINNTDVTLNLENYPKGIYNIQLEIGSDITTVQAIVE